MPNSIWRNATLAVIRRLSRLSWLRNAAARRQASDYAARLRVKCRDVRQPVRELSGGNQQKVVLSKWLMTNPRVIILDEPTRGIDVGAKAEVHRLVADLAASGVAILMISSELPEILSMSDRRAGDARGQTRHRVRSAPAPPPSA
jgi:ABC-type sugar transport system ATPase subunit